MLLVGVAYAAPVNLPNGIKGNEGLFLTEKMYEELDYAKEIGVSASFVFDDLLGRKMKDFNAKADAKIYEGKLAFTFFNRFDIYALLGAITSAEYKGMVSGSDVKLGLKDKFMVGGGLNVVIYEWQQSGISLFADANYRTASDMPIDSATVDGTKYSLSSIVNAKAKWQEWQGALGISKKFKYCIPYFGIKYSDATAGAKATVSGTTYDFGHTGSKNKVGPFVGISILPIKGVSVDIDGRFVDEEAFSVSATLRF
jgi:hypothetical protein